MKASPRCVHRATRNIARILRLTSKPPRAHSIPHHDTPWEISSRVQSSFSPDHKTTGVETSKAGSVRVRARLFLMLCRELENAVIVSVPRAALGQLSSHDQHSVVVTGVQLPEAIPYSANANHEA